MNPNSRWIQCDLCGECSHVTCIGLTNERAKALTQYTCRDCKKGRKLPPENLPNPEERFSRSRTTEGPRAEPTRPVEEEEVFEIDQAEESDYSGPVEPSEQQGSPKLQQVKQRCPCGNSRPMAVCVKCYNCTQIFHAACVGLSMEQARRQFVCTDCQEYEEPQEQEHRDRAFAGLLGLREDLNQSELLAKVPGYNDFAKRLNGRESFDFTTDDFSVYHDSAPTDTVRHSSPLFAKAKPNPKPRQSILRNRDAGEQRANTRSSASRATETPSGLNFNRGSDNQMQINRTSPPDKDVLLNESELERRLHSSAPASVKEKPGRVKTSKRDARTSSVTTQESAAGSEMQILRRNTGAPSGGGHPRQVSRREVEQRSLSPLLDAFEKTVVDSRIQELGEHLEDVEHEYQVTLARLKCLARERDNLQKAESSRSSARSSRDTSTSEMRPIKQVSASNSGTLYRRDHGDNSDYLYDSRNDVPSRVRLGGTSRSVHFDENNIPSSKHRSCDYMSPDEVQRQVDNMSLGNDTAKKSQGEKGHPPRTSGPKMEIGKAVLTLAERMAQLHASNRYVTGLTTLKVLTGTEGPEGTRRYFRQFELMTRDWSPSEKLDALSVKLEGRAYLVFSSMPSHMQGSFEAVKSELLERLANEEPKRVRKLADLMSGKPRATNESIAAFGERILQLVRDACDSDCPASQIDELCKAYFVNWVNDRDLIPSLTEKRDSMEFRKLVDHAAALRTNLNQYKRVANESAAFNPASPPAHHASASRNAAPPQRRDAPQHFNPNRVSLRYQGQFPPPRNNFAGARTAGPAANSNATEASASSGGIEQAVSEPAPATNEPEMTSIWEAMPESYVDPLAQDDTFYPRRMRRRRSPRERDEPPVTTNVLIVEHASEPVSNLHTTGAILPIKQDQNKLSKVTRALPEDTMFEFMHCAEYVKDVWLFLPNRQIQKFRPVTKFLNSLYCEFSISLPRYYTPENGFRCDGWFTDEETDVDDEKGAAATVSAIDTVSPPASLGCTCTTIVLVRGMPCEALIDSGSRISLIEAGYLKGLLLESGAKLDDMTLRKSRITSISCANRSQLHSPAAMTIEVAYGGHCVLAELQVTTEKLAFPIILGTNCLTDLGFQLVNVYTGEELLSVASDGIEAENAALPAVDVCATADVTIPPYGTAIISARLPERGNSNIRCISSCVPSTASVDALVKVENNVETCFWLTNSEPSPVSIAEGQVVGKACPVEEICTSSDIIATEILEELLGQANVCVASKAAHRDSSINAPFDPPLCPRSPRDERLRKLIELLGEPEVELSEAQTSQLVSLLSEYLDTFALSDSELGQTGLVKHKIELVDPTPIRQAERPLPYVMREKVASMIRDYLERKVIRPSTSSFSSPIVLVRKKPERGSEKEAQLRFCVDYRALNARTAKFAGPIPNIDYLLLTMGPKKYFTSLDMISGYWQIELEEESQPLTAFPALGSLYEFNVLSFRTNQCARHIPAVYATGL